MSHPNVDIGKPKETHRHLYPNSDPTYHLSCTLLIALQTCRYRRGPGTSKEWLWEGVGERGYTARVVQEESANQFIDPREAETRREPFRAHVLSVTLAEAETAWCDALRCG